jgi:hypothetical protein
MSGPITHAERPAGSASPGATTVRGKRSRVPGLSQHPTVPEAQLSFAWTSEVPVETKNLGEVGLLDPAGIESRQPQVVDAGPTQVNPERYRSGSTGGPAFLVTIAPVEKAPGRFSAQRGDRLLVKSSRQPFLDAARRLLLDGCDPGAIIIMRHAGSDIDALRSTAGAAAKLTVEEGDRTAPSIRSWKAFPCTAVAPPIEPDKEDVSRPAAPSRTPRRSSRRSTASRTVMP